VGALCIIQSIQVVVRTGHPSACVFLLTATRTQVDAAIVRIMKARKKLGHALLMSELFSQVGPHVASLVMDSW
jgi:hypothetical protein